MRLISYHRSIKQSIDEMLIAKADSLTPIVYQYFGRLREGGFDEGLVDAVVQTGDRNPLDIYDACIFAQVWLSLHEGKVLLFMVDAGCGPFMDAKGAENDSILRKLADQSMYLVFPGGRKEERIRGTISGSFIGGTSIGDGYFKWTTGIPLHTKTDNEHENRVDIPSCNAVPLEIGYTRSTTTAYHLSEDGRLARWPYNSHWIYVFYSRQKWSLWGQPNWEAIDKKLSGQTSTVDS